MRKSNWFEKESHATALAWIVVFIPLVGLVLEYFCKYENAFSLSGCTMVALALLALYKLNDLKEKIAILGKKELYASDEGIPKEKLESVKGLNQQDLENKLDRLVKIEVTASLFGTLIWGFGPMIIKFAHWLIGKLQLF